VLLLRSYLLAGNASHYDGVISALEARGLRVLPVFATGLDARPAIEQFFFDHGRPVVDAVVSLTGFSLVGGPAYNDARAAEEILAGSTCPTWPSRRWSSRAWTSGAGPSAACCRWKPR
jgi:magnesium chelatase subunit H